LSSQPSNELVICLNANAAQNSSYRSENQIRQSNELLEERVAARTAELLAANQRLTVETEERRRAEIAPHHAQKLESIGQLTSGIAHDFSNLLTAVLGNLEIAQLRIKGEAVQRRLANARMRRNGAPI